MVERTVTTRGTGRADYTQATVEVLRTPVPILRQPVTPVLSTVTFDPPVKSVLLSNVSVVDCNYERNGTAAITKGTLGGFSSVSLAGQSISTLTFITSSGTTAVDITPER